MAERREVILKYVFWGDSESREGCCWGTTAERQRTELSDIWDIRRKPARRWTEHKDAIVLSQ